ncbi:nucleoside triphosphate pyrophosphohydrolase [Tepidibacillus fermentans]|uniref:Tetrapyrrole methylase family protein/MazG family protein n=1 Tax=Tepidibacillus fermentans TaxID=1281767 RepID=A0A4R3KAV6_9BACI|nr:nucleoside triphosphate pyrophosphohydrolase [Tepidibacillus fermentans]TCS80157.1 tetrapyrrole methylase family protein/MazG family protein [Tepidibacillus fermentans]
MKAKITIVGLGAGNEDQLSLGIYKKLKNSKHIYLRTKVHPVVSFLDEEGIQYQTFDELYDQHSEYDHVYQEIARILLGEAKKGNDLIYGVPGHPMVAEKSVQYLLEQHDSNIEIELLGGESFLDAVFSSLKIDPIEGFLFLNGETLKRDDIQPSKHMIIGQVYDQWIASDVKLTLMEIYPDDWPVIIASNLGMKGKERLKEVPLYELDRNPNEFHHLSSIFIRKTDSPDVHHSQFSKLVEIINQLRMPNGCPWDRAQTHQSIRKNLLEETYELLETIDQLDIEHMQEELGDVLLQVMLHSQMASEEGYFHIYDVIKQLNDKLVRRHPHVFGNENAERAEEALVHWEKMKEKEREEKGIEKIRSVLDGIPKDLPEILKAYKLQSKAAKVGFDWSDIRDVYQKIDEEIEEIRHADQADLQAEVGDLLFAVINLSRFLKVDPEAALAMTNRKFIKRFQYIEKQLKEKQMDIYEASLDVMDQLWNEAKTLGKGD